MRTIKKKDLEILEQLDWFKLKNYDCLLDLTLQQLLDQLLFRIQFYSTIEEDPEDTFHIFPNTDEWQGIISGKPIVRVTSKSELKKDNCKCLTELPGISALTDCELRHYATVTELTDEEPEYIVKASSVFGKGFTENLCDECFQLFADEVESEFYQENDSYINFKSLCQCCQSYVEQHQLKQAYHLPSMPNKCKTCNPYTAVFHGSDVTRDDLLLRLNLEDYTDTELISMFSDVLKESRKVFNIKEPSRVNSGKAELYFKNIIRQKIIPYLDIRIWTIYKHVKDNDPLREMYESGLYVPESFQFEHSINIIKKLPFPVFNKILFNGSQSEYYFLNQLHKKYFTEYLNYQNINISQIYLRSNPDFRDQKVKNIIGLYKQ